MTWENAAVVLAIAYLVLAMRESVACWIVAFASSTIYAALFWNVGLLMESALSVFYVGMAVYGWWQWTRGGVRHEGVPIRRWPLRFHLAAAAGVAACSVFFGWILSTRTVAAWPYLDSFTTVASVVTTFMVARKVLENWLYWIVIDAADIVLYVDRGLESTAVLYAGYVVLAFFGYRSWRRRLSGGASGAVGGTATTSFLA